MLPGKRRFKDFLENPVTKYMEDIVKGYTKITAALAAFVLLFIAIGVSTPGTASAQAATITIVPTSATTLTADAKKNNTACSVITGTSTCAAGDNTYTITVTDAAANLIAAEYEVVTVTVKNADLATVTPSTATDSNAKTITLRETGAATGVFTRLVTTKHASTGLVLDGATHAVTAVTDASNFVIGGLADPFLAADRTLMVASNFSWTIADAAGNSSIIQCSIFFS